MTPDACRHCFSVDPLKNGGKTTKRAIKLCQAQFDNYTTVGKLQWEARWPSGQRVERRQFQRSGFEQWPGLLCCVLTQDSSLKKWLSPSKNVDGYWRIVKPTRPNVGSQLD